MVKFNVFNIKLGRCYKRAYTLVHALIRVPTKVLRDCHKLIRKALLAVYFCLCGVDFLDISSSMSSTPMVSIMGVHIADMLIGITPKKKEELPWKCLQEMRTTKVR